ncbi:MAG: hypothetical protein MUF02_01435 [Acidobacteria bacterium]|nr:hypothetical protein [Acidobacteriota bacterium]
MTHKRIFRVMVLAAFVAMVVIAPLQAAPDCGKPGCPKKGDQEKAMGKGCMAGHGCMMLTQIPNLSAEQKAKLEKLHAVHKAEMAAAMAEMQKKCQAHYQAVKAQLSDEQKAKLPEMGSCMKEGKGGCMMGGMKMEGKGCMEKHGHEKGECQKKAGEEKK